MLTNNLQETLNKKWKNCWPVSELRPLAIFDLLSYFYFIKKADDLDLIHQKTKKSGLEDFIYSAEIEHFTWSNLQSQQPKEIHHLFTKEHGLINLMKHYAKTNASFSDYFKAPLLIEPTPKLVLNAIEIINIIESSDPAKRISIIEYLFTKLSNSNQDKEAFLADPILKLIINLAEPVKGDIIFDPAAGNGIVLINAYKYNKKLSLSTKSELKLSGFEPDLVHLRIAAMNMMIHGMTDLNIHLPSVFQAGNEKPSLIVSSLSPFQESDSLTGGKLTGLAENEGNILEDAIERLSSSGRAVVLVRKDFLQSDHPAILKIRKKLVDQNNLEGVITLDMKNKYSLSGSAILVFNKLKSTTENIWFYKWRTTEKNNQDLLNINGNNPGLNEVRQILEKWKSRKDSDSISSVNNFCISANYLRSNNYILSFNDYKLIKEEPISEKASRLNEPETVIAAKKENLHEFFDASASLPVEKKKRKLAPVLLIVFILICAAFAFYWAYSKSNNNYFSKNIADKSSKIDSGNNSDGNISLPSSSNNLVSFKEKKGIKNQTKPGKDSKKYKVINKAWFHNEPDSAKTKSLYIMPRKGVVVTSQKEESGFVYVVYVNNKGESTHGWLDKKDLQAVD